MRFTLMNRSILWEDYKANYVDKDYEKSEVNNEIEEDDFEDFDEDEMQEIDTIRMGKMIIGMPQTMFTGELVSTPWGQFQIDNKFAPFNFYSLKIAHFRGFSSFTIPKFVDVMDGVEGVALWKALDPYCFIIGKARLYTWEEVAKNIDDKLLIQEEVEKSPTVNVAVEKFIQEVNEKNINNYVAIIFPNGKTAITLPTDPDYAEKIIEMADIQSKIKDSIVIENGVVK